MRSEQLLEKGSVAASWQILHDVWTNEIGYSQGKVLPNGNGCLELGIVRVQLRNTLACRQPVIPVQLVRLSPPLLFEPVRPAAWGRSTKIKELESFLTSIFQD